jgi:CubicO group peptidase (beta-lactamase class C family)
VTTRRSPAAQLALVPLLVALCACGTRPRQARIPTASTIDSMAKQLMQREQVHGMALAIIDSGRIRHIAAYGWRNAEQRLPLTPATVMYGASLTKTAVAYLVLQLVDEGRLSLDATAADLLPKPLPEYEDYTDLAGDPRWRAVTPRIVLTHTTGFANFRWLEDDRKLRFHRDPGTRYGYSGEGFYVLQLMLEEGLKLDLGREMQARIFDRFGMTHTSMQWRPDFAENLADGYRQDGTMEPHDERSSASAAGSMDTSIEDQARMWAAIVRGDGLSAASRQELVRPQVPITSLHQFPTLRDWTGPTNAAIGLAAGLGVVTYRVDGGTAWFKGGHNDSTGNLVICLERRQRCLVMLANDVRAERIYPELARAILGEVAMPWGWEYDWYRPAAEGAQ